MTVPCVGVCLSALLGRVGSYQVKVTYIDYFMVNGSSFFLLIRDDGLTDLELDILFLAIIRWLSYESVAAGGLYCCHVSL